MARKILWIALAISICAFIPAMTILAYGLEESFTTHPLPDAFRLVDGVLWAIVLCSFVVAATASLFPFRKL